ncbi:mitochondrial pyruvate carrier 4-like isoform X2 [Pyrus x bretschneideri]|nr:mitochondrial pyruvate carrier 4-like isoform X2 [Pyrus x bretschneideri]
MLYIQSDLPKGSENHFMANSKLQAFWNHPAGPKTIHFWAPTFKWGLTIANILDSATPPEKLSYPQQSVLACSGLIWARYSTVIIPKNWNLVSVNFAMSVTAMYQLSRKIQHDLSIKNKEVAAEEE